MSHPHSVGFVCSWKYLRDVGRIFLVSIRIFIILVENSPPNHRKPSKTPLSEKQAQAVTGFVTRRPHGNMGVRIIGTPNSNGIPMVYIEISKSNY